MAVMPLVSHNNMLQNFPIGRAMQSTTGSLLSSSTCKILLGAQMWSLPYLEIEINNLGSFKEVNKKTVEP